MIAAQLQTSADPSKQSFENVDSTVQRLKDSMRLIDSFSEDAFLQIDTLSSVSLKRLEDASVLDDYETMARMLECIREIARTAKDNIASETAHHGCESDDKAVRGRIRAACIKYENDRCVRK